MVHTETSILKNMIGDLVMQIAVLRARQSVLEESLKTAAKTQAEETTDVLPTA